jgi:hypothetical protein
MSITRIRWGWVCVMVLVPVLRISGQVTAVGARSVSVAGVASVFGDAWAVANNPAGLAGYEHFSLGTSLEQRYLLPELGYYAVSATIPAFKGCLGGLAMFSGYGSFIDQKISLAYGKPFGGQFKAGVSLVYIFQKAGDESGAVHQVSYKIGTLVKLSEKVDLAFTAFNPFQLYFKSKDYATLPSVFDLGLLYRYSSSLNILAEAEKDLLYPPCLKVGAEYIFRDLFFIRGGIRIFPFSWSFGAAYRYRHYLVEIASSYHQYLGFSPVITFQYDLR